MHSHLLAAKKLAGIEFIGQPNMDFLKVDKMKNILAMDAQPALVTTSNAGIPAFLSTYLDPKLIEVLVSPMKATEIVGSEEKKGDFTTETIMFEVVENTGEVSSYGDYNENGSAGINVDFPQRQSYLYQTITQWGERQLERAGLAKLDFASRINMASILTLNKFQNLSYFFGVGGLQNYGLLNDPNLLPALTPAIKAAGGTEWLNPTTFEPNATAHGGLRGYSDHVREPAESGARAGHSCIEAHSRHEPGIGGCAHLHERIQSERERFARKEFPESHRQDGPRVRYGVGEPGANDRG